MRASLYLLAAALFDDPRPEQREILSALLSRVVDVSADGSPWIPPLIEVADGLQRDEEDLRCEHARLFVLAAPRVTAQPYGSYWLEAERQLMGRTTVDVSNLMRQHGLMPEAHAGLLPDHLVCELEFMAYLADRETREATRATQETLLREHLGVWVPWFLQALQASEPSRYYRMAARYLDEVITWDLRRLAVSPERHSTAA